MSRATAASKTGGEAGVVEEEAIGGAVKEDSAEAELLDGALELFGCGLRLLEGEAREGGEAGGIRVDGGGEFVVDVVGEGGRGGSVQLVEFQGGEGQDLEVNACFIHGGEASGSKVQELGLESGKPGWYFSVVGAGGTEEGFRHEMFFKRNSLHAWGHVRLDERKGLMVPILRGRQGGCCDEFVEDRWGWDFAAWGDWVQNGGAAKGGDGGCDR